MVENKKRKDETKNKKTAEDRTKDELDKVAAYQARIAKKKNKLRKMKTVVDDDQRSFNKIGTFENQSLSQIQ